jgi:hypothetical protein
MLRSIPRMLAVLVLSAPAALAAPDHGFPFDPRRAPFEMGRLMSHTARSLPLPSCGPSFRFTTPRFSFGFGCRPVHQHCFTEVCEREWVAPQYCDRVVGYDLCGRPIVRPILVRAGYWTTVRYRVCDCGVRYRL